MLAHLFRACCFIPRKGLNYLASNILSLSVPDYCYVSQDVTMVISYIIIVSSGVLMIATLSIHATIKLIF